MEQIVLTHNVKFCIFAVYATVLFIHLVALVLKLMKRNVENFLVRMKSFWIIILLFTGVFCITKEVAYAFITLLSFFALKEFLAMIPTRPVDKKVHLWAYLAIPVQFYFLYTNWIVMFYLFIPLYMFILIPVRMIMVKETEGFLKSCASIHWGLMVCVYAIGYLALYLNLPETLNPVGGNIGLLLFILLMTIGNDFMQYLFGKTMGRNKIVPTISPNKTWEGFLGGVFSSTLLGMFLAPMLTPFDYTHGAFIGFVLSIAGFVGDVTMSAIKRDIGVKDTGSLIPGHGGILDRLDSLIFTAPLFFHYLAYVLSINILK